MAGAVQLLEIVDYGCEDRAVPGEDVDVVDGAGETDGVEVEVLADVGVCETGAG